MWSILEDVIMQLPHHRPRLLEAKPFAEDLISKVEASKLRIAIVVTTFHNDDEVTSRLVDALCAAAKRGVMVSICADVYTYTEPKEFMLRFPKRQPMRALRAMSNERKLKSHGVDFHWLGRNSNFIFAGRTHAKWMVLDDYIYSFGGVNIDKNSFNNTDLMMRFFGERVADIMFNQHLRLLKADRANHASRSHAVKLDDKTTLLFDGGIPGDSIIYRRAVRLARQASSVTLVSQYCPTGKFARILKRKDAALYFNHWKHAQWVNKGMIRLGMLYSRQQTLYTRDDYLHAKFVLFTMPDGSKVAITGSHNFMSGSVFLGTREVAIQTSDHTIIASLEKFHKKRVA